MITLTKMPNKINFSELVYGYGSTNYYKVIKSNPNFNIYCIRTPSEEDPEKRERKFLTFGTYDSALYPYCDEFFENFFPFSLIVDGVERKLKFFKRNGKILGAPLSNFFKNSSQMNPNNQFNLNQNMFFKFLETVDGEYVVWITDGLFTQMGNNSAKFHVVITKKVDFGKQFIGEISYIGTKRKWILKNQFGFYYAPFYTSNVSAINVNYLFSQEETKVAQIKIYNADAYTTNPFTNFCYKPQSNKYIWDDSVFPNPPNGWEREYDLYKGEEWSASNSLVGYSYFCRFPCWEGTTAMYATWNIHTQLGMTAPFFHIIYDFEDRKWKAIESTKKVLFETDVISEDAFDVADEIRFNWVGGDSVDADLTEEQKNTLIEEGFVFKFTKYISITSYPSLLFDSSIYDSEIFKKIHLDFLEKTGRPKIYLTDGIRMT